MIPNGPKIGNVVLDGVLDKHGPAKRDHTLEQRVYTPPPTA